MEDFKIIKDKSELSVDSTPMANSEIKYPFNSIIHKTILSFFVLGMVIWIGGTLIRFVIAYDIFVPGTELVLKPYYSDDLRVHTIQLFASTSVYTEIGFAVSFFCSIFFLFNWRKKLKTYGWLFMSLVLFFMSCPVEFYIVYLNINLMYQFLTNQVVMFNDPCVTNYFFTQFRILNQLAPLTFLLAITSMIIVVWKPLDKSPGRN